MISIQVWGYQVAIWISDMGIPSGFHGPQTLMISTQVWGYQVAMWISDVGIPSGFHALQTLMISIQVWGYQVAIWTCKDDGQGRFMRARQFGMGFVVIC